MKEQELQEWYAYYLNNKGVLFCASSGGMRTNIRTAIKMRRAGYKKGFPDIFIYEPRGAYCGMAVEVKLGSYPSEEQKEWRSQLVARGYCSIIVPATLDIAEAQDFLKNQTEVYLSLKKAEV